MKRSKHTLYLTRKLKLQKTEQLDKLALASGDLYTRTLVSFWRTRNKKNIWLSQYGMEKWHMSDQLHAHTSDAIVGCFYDALASWKEARKINPEARPPRRRKRYYKIVWKNSAIKIKDGVIRLSNGRGNDFLYIPWRWGEPNKVEIGWDGDQYELRASYGCESTSIPIGNRVAGIDLGEVHIAASHDGTNTYLINGRELRSKKRYLNKTKAKLQSKIDKKKRGSRRRGQLIKSKRKQTKRLNNQVRDILHKQTTHLVSTLYNDGVDTVVIGDLRNVRINNDCGRKNNQKIHQMHSGESRQMITYKSKKLGMKVEMQDEYYTSKDCPRCGHRNDPKGRNYICEKCNFIYHRDGVGSINIRKKYLGSSPVVGVMASPIGLRYKPNKKVCKLNQCSSKAS